MLLSEKLFIMYEKSKSLIVLYAEDDLNLQKQTEQFLRRIFSNLYVASNGLEALELYKKVNCDILITDIKMPFMSGLELANSIKHINPKVEIIITSAFDEKDFLLQSIEIGVLYYLVKPLKTEVILTKLDKTIDKVLIEKKIEERHKTFEDIVIFQKNILLLVEDLKIKFCNRAFLEFFGLKNIKDIGSIKFYQFAKVVGINHDFENDKELFAYIINRSDELLKIELKNGEQSKKFLLTIDKLPYQKEEYSINFIEIDKLLDANFFSRNYTKDVNIDLNRYDIAEFIHEFKKVENINDDINFYNFYKGLTIFHKGTIVSIYEDKIKVVVDKFQLLAFAYEKKTFIHSETLNRDICADVEFVNIAEQFALLNNFKYLDSSPRFRESMRVEVDEPLENIYIDRENIFLSGKIRDLSTKSISIVTKELLDLEPNMDVNLSFYLNYETEKVKIKTKGKVFKISKEQEKYIIVVLLNLIKRDENEVSKFISKTQINLIKEFKNKTPII